MSSAQLGRLSIAIPGYRFLSERVVSDSADGRLHLGLATSSDRAVSMQAVLGVYHVRRDIRAVAEAMVAAAAHGIEVPTVLSWQDAADSPLRRAVLLMAVTEGERTTLRIARRRSAAATFRQLGAMHASVHAVADESLCSATQKETTAWIDHLQGRIASFDLQFRGLERIFEQLRLTNDGRPAALLHGDFHYRNVLAVGNVPTLLDWTHAQWGDPALDVARTTILPAIAEALWPGARWTLRRVLDRRTVWYLEGYRSHCTIQTSKLQLWRRAALASAVTDAVENALTGGAQKGRTAEFKIAQRLCLRYLSEEEN